MTYRGPRVIKMERQPTGVSRRRKLSANGGLKAPVAAVRVGRAGDLLRANDPKVQVQRPTKVAPSAAKRYRKRLP